MNTREMAVEYRMSHWAGIMRERKDSSMSIRAYCKQAGFHENEYYYWQRKLREAACAEFAQRESRQPAAPSGWALCTTETNPAVTAENGQSEPVDQITVEVSGLRITAGREYPAEKLAQLLRELKCR